MPWVIRQRRTDNPNAFVLLPNNEAPMHFPDKQHASDAAEALNRKRLNFGIWYEAVENPDTEAQERARKG